ncbi:MAG: MerR family transcriptional regulator [Actinomycetaceae bacterium]|nr:MerR family transcriptional regulator [Actinomycetaceae bacterium]
MNARATTTTYVISVAAELAGMHPQTLRQYDRLGLVTPQRTRGRGRRYTARDVERLREVQRLSQDEGINLEGIRRILQLQADIEKLRSQREALAEEVTALRAEAERLEQIVAEARHRRERVFSANARGDVSAVRRGYRPAAPAPQGGELVHVPWPNPVPRQSNALVLFATGRH